MVLLNVPRNELQDYILNITFPQLIKVRPTLKVIVATTFLAAALVGCNSIDSMNDSEQAESPRCSMVTNDEEYLISDWQGSQKFAIGIGNFNCGESIELKFNFGTNSYKNLEVDYFLIPESEQFKVGVISESIFDESINSRILVEDEKAFLSLAGSSQIVALISMPDKKDLANKNSIEFQVNESGCLQENGNASKCRINGNINFSINFSNR